MLTSHKARRHSSRATGGAVRIGQVTKNRPVAHPQGIGDLRHSQTMGSEDLGPGLARLSHALLPALLGYAKRTKLF
jgi:hypothetical protein